ncbi:hypothetical protein [Novosphingobium sp.]|uniref:hypothetical protein n=1 Tax=Novosphingobium sp. TaxID=1874826 RepID=UPI002603C349|nr:hypothetical protein [Novosphingobium sp.]
MSDKTLPTGDKAALTREERLALRLRENLRRRKAQARALDAAEAGTGDEPPSQA